MNEKVLIIVIAAVAGLLAGFIAVGLSGSGTTGGVYHTVQEDFAEGISVDTNEVIDGSGNWVSPVDVTVKGQCLTLYHASNDTPVYVTTASSTISATTTKPAVCP